MTDNKAVEILNKLEKFGGSPQGVTRLTYSEAYKKAQDFLREYMLECNMSVEVDAMGNLIGTYQGSNPELPAVLTGSHLDTVPNGGKFDGALGIATALACVKDWYEQGYTLKHSLKVIAMAEEEGTLFNIGCMGSRVICGEFLELGEDKVLDARGKSFKEYLADMGLDGNAFSRGVWDTDKLKCFLEVHIEQGEELDRQAINIGIVNSIVGIDRREFVIKGQANHAGTTRMASRKDPLAAVGYFMQRMYDRALAAAGDFVATVGKIEAYPNAVNVIAGEVIIHVETRAGNQPLLYVAEQAIYEIMQEMCTKYNVSYTLKAENKIQPIELSAEIIDIFKDNCTKLGLSSCVMPSWAGHDAKVLAEKVPTGMLFAPSVAGISHSPFEHTNDQDIKNVTAVLKATLARLCND